MRITQIILFLCLLAFGPQILAQSSQSVGQVVFSTGDNYAQVGADKPVKLQAGVSIFVGETLHTNQTGHVHIRMMDGAFLSLRPDSVVTVALYTVDAAHAQNNQIRLDVQKGGVRSVTGAGGQANKAGFRLNTPVAAIGIRGTDFTVFTDMTVSSVSVRQGGVVVSPFSSACSRATLGACNGVQSVMLSAYNQQQVAEVFQQQASLVNKEEARVVPDTVKPAHPAEDKSLKDAKETPITLNTPTQEGQGKSATVASEKDKTASTATSTKEASAAASASSTSTKETASHAATAEGSVPAKSTSVQESSGGVASTNNSTASQAESGASTSTVVKTSNGGSVTLLSPAATSTSALNTGNTGSTVEVASLTPITDTVGAKESVTSEMASRIIAHENEVVTGQAVNAAVSTVVAPPVPIVSPPVAVPKPQVFSWGRWSNYVESPEQNIMADPVRKQQIVAINGPYILTSAEKSPQTGAMPTPNLPSSGEATFALAKGEAGVLMGGVLRPATIANPALTVNFNTDRFTTSMDVNSASLQTGNAHLSANGTLDDKGLLASSAAASNMTVSGRLNSDGSQAGYLFEQSNSGIVGATTWQVQP